MKKNKIKKYKVTCYEITTGEKTICYWTQKQCELADYLARTGGLCLIDGVGYFYRYEDLKNALAKAMENDYWRVDL